MQEQIFQEYPESERERMIRDNAEVTVERTVRRAFTKDEVDGLNSEFAAQIRAVNTKKAELKAIVTEKKADIKVMEHEAQRTLERASNGYDESLEVCYGMADPETKRIVFYDRTGAFVEARNMTPEERQTIIPFQVRREASNGN